ncbi:DUF6191 domain-containing protein [Streptomyces sp. UNOC14_S4]|uniref:DUF6191 domain-containing protein n=1 Tax=Streptomyces sp. UNOC14_S4 TaxID=2872340 RepID=UPI001E5F07E6|nr:DUF6191 domain-containing protein [Streptomyces sp. UNOC14_S4]MCC3771334.1 hypothetical protein [Streptomyces sp. UNOC14_S4]
MFDALEDVFCPGRKHIRVERERQEMCLDDIGDADPGRGPIDLDSGCVTIRLGQG